MISTARSWQTRRLNGSLYDGHIELSIGWEAGRDVAHSCYLGQREETTAVMSVFHVRTGNET